MEIQRERPNGGWGDVANKMRQATWEGGTQLFLGVEGGGSWMTLPAWAFDRFLSGIRRTEIDQRREYSGNAKNGKK